MYSVRTILCPTDLSEQSGDAIEVARSLARDLGARLVVLHVLPPPASRAEAVARRPPDSYRDQIWNDYLLPIEAPGVRLERRLEDGDPAEEIVRVAEEVAADLIVMATHGRTGLGRLLMGSVAEEVLRKAPCPVLTVRAPVLKTVAKQTLASEGVKA
jgi:nucleotide-binding universal stress UspA family protein